MKTKKKSSNELSELPIELLHPNPHQPRRRFRKAGLVELAQSMKNFEQLQPIVLMRHPERKGEYLIVAGERRWRAAQINGWGTVSCIIKEQQYTPLQLGQLALIENEEREGLTPIEVALQFDQFRKSVEEGGFGLSVSEIGRMSRKYERTTVQNMLSLLELPTEVQDMVEDEFLSVSLAKIIVSLPKNFQLQIARAAAKGGWTVKKMMENTAHLTWGRGLKQKKGGGLDQKNEIQAINKVKDIAELRTGAETLIKKGSKGSWSITMKSSSLDEFNGLLQSLGFTEDEADRFENAIKSISD